MGGKPPFTTDLFADVETGEPLVERITGLHELVDATDYSDRSAVKKDHFRSALGLSHPGVPLFCLKSGMKGLLEGVGSVIASLGRSDQFVKTRETTADAQLFPYPKESSRT